LRVEGHFIRYVCIFSRCRFLIISTTGANVSVEIQRWRAPAFTWQEEYQAVGQRPPGRDGAGIETSAFLFTAAETECGDATSPPLYVGPNDFSAHKITPLRMVNSLHGVRVEW